MPRTLNFFFDFWNVCSSKRRLTRFVRVPPYEILVFPTNFIFFQRNEITLWGKKCTALFHTHNWEKSSFFNALVRVFAQIYANTWQGGGTMCPTLGLIGWLQWVALGLKRWSLIGAAKVDLSFDNVEAHVMLYLTNKVVPYKINLKITCKILSYKKLIQPYM